MKLPTLPSLPTSLKSLSLVEICLFLVFAVYIVFPIQMPYGSAKYIDSPVGMITMFCITLYLFLYTNPILGILYLFVAYELLRRSSKVTGRVAMVKYTPTQAKMDAEMKAMNPPKVETLEEMVVAERAPIGKSEPIVFMSSTFKPVADKVDGASVY